MPGKMSAGEIATITHSILRSSTTKINPLDQDSGSGARSSGQALSISREISSFVTKQVNAIMTQVGQRVNTVA